MGEQGKKKAPAISKRSYYKIEGDKVTRARKSCPKCGPGVLIAIHGNRVSCGRCGYTEFTKE